MRVRRRGALGDVHRLQLPSGALAGLRWRLGDLRLAPLSTDGLHPAVRAVLLVEVFLVAGEEDLPIAIRTVEGPRLSHHVRRFRGEGGLAHSGAHRGRAIRRTGFKFPDTSLLSAGPLGTSRCESFPSG